MNTFYIFSRRFWGIVFGFGLLMAPAFAFASVSVSVQSLSPSTNVPVGTTLTFTVSASGFSSPTYGVSDSFGGTSASTNNINSSGQFSWTPTSSDVGTHNLTIYVNDSQGDSASVSEQITVGSSGSAAQLSIQGLTSGGVVIVGTPLTFTAAASSFNNPSFTVSDSFSGSSVSNADINSAGYFSWTPTANDVGTHNFTIYAVDSQGHSANVQEQVIVKTPNITVTSISPSPSVNPNTTVTFTVSPQGFTNPAYTLSDSFSGSAGTSITNSDINSSGVFTWTPGTNDTGTHNITISATDAYGHSANTNISIYVVQSVSVALTAPSPAATVAPGTTVSFDAEAYGFTSPTYSVSDSLNGSTVNNSDINSSGVFTWMPLAGDAGTHTITVTALDTYSHSASAQTTILVTGTPVVQTTTSTASSGLSSAQVQAILSLLQSFGAGQSIINSVSAALGGGSAAASTASAGSGYVFSTFMSVGSIGADVTALQERLGTLGYLSVAATGHFGPLTQAAVEEFQTAHGISAVGYVGPATRAALNGQ